MADQQNQSQMNANAQSAAGSGSENYETELFESVGQKVESLQVGQSESEGELQPVDEIESLCMNCHENGTTRLLLTRIPYFHEVILSSFACPHCHFKDSNIQSAGKIQEFGRRYSFVLHGMEDFSRQVIKSETCIAKFLELDVEIPSGRGQITNIESLLTMIIDDLELAQPARQTLDPTLHAELDTVITRGKAFMAGEHFPLTLLLDDPAGNSMIQPSPNNVDHRWTRTQYRRSPEQNEALSLPEPAVAPPTEKTTSAGGVGEAFQSEIVPDEVYSFPASCPSCTRPCSTHMKMVNIPHFKEVVIMSTVCHLCGYRSNEVKTGGLVPSQGRRITLHVQGPEDLGRDVLKSESCALSCPELDLAVNPGTLGGRFTTLEGLLTQIRDDLHSQVFDVFGEGTKTGDSMASQEKTAWGTFFDNLGKAIRAEMKFSIVLEDPLAASYVQNLRTPDPDPQMVIEDYERTEDEKEDLGLNDIKVEGYEIKDEELHVPSKEHELEHEQA
ncbi:MAG: nucleolar zinc-finger protein [Thelocarpon superellum]|nr:MAG: nucleolar zinc-finger protein [Thelocarpon superellum]